MTIGTKIRTLRKQRKMTQEEVGKMLGLQRAAIQKYENDAVENIPVKTVEKLAILFSVSPMYLLGWEDNDQKLSQEVKTIRSVQESFGKSAVSALELFTSLNVEGQSKVISYLDDLSNLERYQIISKN